MALKAMPPGVFLTRSAVLIVVCVKQVPASNDVRIDPVTNNLVRDSVEGMMNPFDKHAVEAALTVREQAGGRVVALSMGPRPFMDTLREALALGCDEARLLSSRALAGADTLATAYALAKAVERLGPVDLVFFGRQAVDADTGQVGPIVAEFLNRPQATLVKKLELRPDGHLVATRLLGRYEETVRVRMPAVITVAAEMNTPRYPTPLRIMKAAKADIPVLDENDLDCDPGRIGLKGSRTVVDRVFAPPQPNRHVEMLGGPGGRVEETARRVIEILVRRNCL